MIICFNGPPQAGKDTCASMWPGMKREVRFTNPMDVVLKQFVGEEDFDRYRNADKDKPIMANGHTPRNFLQEFSELLAKPYFGDSIFGAIAGRTILEDRKLDATYVIPDCGFAVEYVGLENFIGHTHKVILVRIDRPGHNFDNDTREYIEGYDYHIHNDGTLEDLDRKMRDLHVRIMAKV